MRNSTDTSLLLMLSLLSMSFSVIGFIVGVVDGGVGIRVVAVTERATELVTSCGTTSVADRASDHVKSSVPPIVPRHASRHTLLTPPPAMTNWNPKRKCCWGIWHNME
jgi:hypothetical protein